MKELKDLTWDELVALNMQKIHLGLLRDGGKGMEEAVAVAMDTTLRWRLEQK
jgi:hypothetical protein